MILTSPAMCDDPSTIYLIVEPDSLFPEDWRATALTADGRELATAVYLEEEKARRRIGNAHGLYRRSCPEGYTLVWAEEDPAGVTEARRLYQERWDAERPAREAEHARQMEALRESRRAIAPTSPLLVISDIEADRRAAEEAWRAIEGDD